MRLLLFVLLFMVLPSISSSAQEKSISREGGMQAFMSQLNGGTDFYSDTYSLRDLKAGDVVYVNVQPFNGDLEVYLLLWDAFSESAIQEGRRVAAIPIPHDGPYTLDVIARGDTKGEYRLYVAVNDVSVLDIRYPFQCGKLRERPPLTGVEQRKQTAHFVIHYTTTGTDSATQAYVDAVAEAFEYIWDELILRSAWSPPPPDCGEGGDRQFDIYLKDILGLADALGLAAPEVMVGDNPATPQIEQFAAYSYIILDNDMGNDLRLMQAAVAHEFHHNIQFGYDMNDPYSSMYESGAVWIQQRLFPDSGIAMNFTDLFRTPDICMGFWQGQKDPYPDRPYNEWLLIESLTRDFAGLATYRTLWEYLARGDGLPAFYGALTSIGTSPQQVVMRMAVRNLLLSYRNGNFYRERVKIEATINGFGILTPASNGIQQLGVDYLLISRPAQYQFTITQANLFMFLIGIKQSEHTAYVHHIGLQGSVDTRPYDYAYLMILNTDLHTSDEDCVWTDWLLNVSDGSGQSMIPSTGEVWNATFFVPAG